MVRSLGLLDVTMLGIAGMVGGSVFVLIGIVSGLAGPSIILAFLINGVISLITAMSYAELGSAFPDTGGGYLWVREALPRPNPFISGWLAWFAHSVAGSLYALSFGAFLSGLLGVRSEVSGIPLEKLIAALAIVAFTLLNIKGASETGRMGSIITMSQIIIVGTIIVSGSARLYANPDWQANFIDFFPNGIPGLLAAMSVSFIAFEGYEIIAQTGEEVIDSRRNIPRAIFMSLGAVVAIYVLLAFVVLAGTPASVTGGVPTWRWLGGLGEGGVIEASRSFMPFGDIVVLAGGVISTLSALNATTYSSSRLAFAMGRAFNLPFVFSRLSRFRTPHIAILASGGIMSGMITLTIEQVAVASGLMFILLFTQVNAAAIVIRKNFGGRLNYGFKSPFFPIVPILGITLKIALMIVIAFYAPLALAIAMAWLAIGYVVYRAYVVKTEVSHVAPLIHETGDLEKLGRRVVVVLGERDDERLARVAILIARQKSLEVDFLKVVLVPRRMPLSAGVLGDKDRVALEGIAKLCRDNRMHYRAYVKVSHDMVDAILLTIQERRSVMVIVPLEYLLGMKRLLVLAPCDVVGCRVNQPLPEKGRIVIAYDLGRHSLHTIDIAHALCRANGSILDVVHVNTKHEGAEDEIEKDIAGNLETIGLDEYKLTVMAYSQDPVPKIGEFVRSVRPDLLVVGVGNPHAQIFSRKTARIIRMTESNLVAVKGFDVPILSNIARLKLRISQSMKRFRA